MIVQDPPYDLVALFSDLEMQKLFEVLIERGQETGRKCARSFRWRSLRDPRRDPVWQRPEQILTPFLRTECRFLVAWDHQGSGGEDRPPAAVEAEVVKALKKAGVEGERVLAVAFDPEVERLLAPIWPRVKAVVAGERKMAAPEDPAVLARVREEVKRRRTPLAIPDDLEQALAIAPKELFEAMVRLVRLRRSAPLYQRVGQAVSLPGVKRDSAAARIADTIATWFPLGET